MAELEKVIKGLEEAKEYFRECRSNESIGSKAENHFWELQNATSEAAELLKAQEPRVMKFDELEDTIADRAVWYEAFLTEVPTIAIVCEKSIADDAYTIFDFISGRHRVTRKTYGACWRCWTSRPTDEQREAVKWDE